MSRRGSTTGHCHHTLSAITQPSANGKRSIVNQSKNTSCLSLSLFHPPQTTSAEKRRAKQSQPWAHFIMHSSKPHVPCKMLNPLSHSYSSLQRTRTNRHLLQLLFIQVVGLRDLAHPDNLTLIVRGTTKDSARIQESAPPAPPPAPGPPLKPRERIRRLPVVDPHHIHLVQTFLHDRAATP